MMKKTKTIAILKNQGVKEFLRYILYRLKNGIKRNFKRHIIENLEVLNFKALPKNYNFVVFYTHLSGHSALGYFFNLCGLNQITLRAQDTIIEYQKAKEQLEAAQNNPQNNVLVVHNNRIYRGKKNYPLVSKLVDNTKILILTRDPISRFKTSINHVVFNVEKAGKKVFLKDNSYEILDKVRYVGGGRYLT